MQISPPVVTPLRMVACRFFRFHDKLVLRLDLALFDSPRSRDDDLVAKVVERLTRLSI